MSSGNLEVSLFIGAHRDLHRFRASYPMLTDQLLGGDKRALDMAVSSNAIIPVQSDCEVSIGPTSTWDDYEVKLRSIIYNELRRSKQKEIDLNAIASMITKTILENHKTNLTPTLLLRDRRETTIHIGEYVNDKNRLLLSYSGTFEVTEKSKTSFKDWNIRIRGELEIKFLYLNLELLSTLEQTIRSTPKHIRESLKANIFSSYGRIED